MASPRFSRMPGKNPETDPTTVICACGEIFTSNPRYPHLSIERERAWTTEHSTCSRRPDPESLAEASASFERVATQWFHAVVAAAQFDLAARDWHAAQSEYAGAWRKNPQRFGVLS